MKHACTLALAASLAFPAAAGAKGGVIFDRIPDTQRIGAPMKFTVMLFNHRHARPLVTFHNRKTRRVVRVRATRGDLNGIAYGTVSLPSAGPWDTRISVNGRVVAPGDAPPFRVGVGLYERIPAANAAKVPVRPATDPDDAFPWALVAAAAAGCAALSLAARRRRGAA